MFLWQMGPIQLRANAADCGWCELYQYSHWTCKRTDASIYICILFL